MADVKALFTRAVWQGWQSPQKHCTASSLRLLAGMAAVWQAPLPVWQPSGPVLTPSARVTILLGARGHSDGPKCPRALRWARMPPAAAVP